MRSSTIRHGLEAACLAFALILSSCAYTAWDRARSEDSLAAYSQFVRDHPTSMHLNEARERMDFLRVKTYKTRESYEEFQRNHPNSSLSVELRELIEPLYFNEARSANTAAAYAAFLQRYPKGSLSARAQGDLEYVSSVLPALREANLRQFVTAHPESDFIDEARNTLELLELQRQTDVHKLGIRVEVSPNVAQPSRVRAGFASMFAQLYRDRGVKVSMIDADASPATELDAWVWIDYREAPASGVLGAATMVANCRVRIYHQGFDDPIWDRTFEAPADHLIRGAYGRDKTVFASSKYRFWENFFVPVATWAVSRSHVQKLDYLEELQDVDVLGERAALLLEHGGIDFVDISSPPSLTVIDRYRREMDLATWYGVRLLSDDMAVTYGTDGIELIRRAEAAAERLAKFDGPTIGPIRGAVLYDQNTLLVGGNQGLYAIRMNRAPLVPQRLLDGEVVGLELRPPYVVVVRPNKVELALPKHLLLHLTEKKVQLPGFPVQKARLVGDRLYLFGPKGVAQVNVANPQKPKAVGVLVPTQVGRITDLAGDPERLYLLGERGLQVALNGKFGVQDYIQVHADRAIGVRGRFAVLVGNHAVEVLDLSPYSMIDPVQLAARVKVKPKPRTKPGSETAAAAPDDSESGGKPNRGRLEPTNAEELKKRAIANLLDPDRKPPTPFAGAAAGEFSDATVASIKTVLDCESKKKSKVAAVAAPYCAALDRFKTSSALPAGTNGAWGGAGLVLIAGSDGKVADVGEGVFGFYLKDQTAAFYRLTPDNEAEAAEMQTLLEAARDGKAPGADTSVMKFLASTPPPLVNPVGTVANSLSFEASPGAEWGMPEERLPEFAREPFHVFVRENATEILVVDIWGKGYSVQLGIFPKPTAASAETPSPAPAAPAENPSEPPPAEPAPAPATPDH